MQLDVYYPDSATDACPPPAVIFVHGEAGPELLANAKDWGQYVSWGQLTACAGLAAVTFNHRSTCGFTQLPEVAADIADLISYVRSHATELGIDAERIGLWVASGGGPTGLHLALSDCPDYLRCIAAYYPILDLRPARGVLLPPDITDDIVLGFSPAASIGPHTAPLMIAKAGRDWTWLNQGIDAFLMAAIEHNLDVEFHNHSTGQHAFDILDDDPRSHSIIRHTLGFFRRHLLESAY